MGLKKPNIPNTDSNCAALLLAQEAFATLYWSIVKPTTTSFNDGDTNDTVDCSRAQLLLAFVHNAAEALHQKVN